MQRRAIEFHESTVLVARFEGRDLRLRLSAYVHISEGEPGRDPGTGWTQDVDLIFGEAELETSLPRGAMEIAHGRLRIGDRAFEGLLPVPLEGIGATTLELQGVGGDLRVIAKSVSLRPVGEACLVEDFPGEE